MILYLHISFHSIFCPFICTYLLQLYYRPAFLSESEVSVYDLKDHPDFQYRPATIVIRVANFVGEDANCTAGQV